ncbi:MAG: hypothetical protein ACRDH5_04225 [bacterium]
MIVDPDQAVEMVGGLVADQGFELGEPMSRAERMLALRPHLQEVYDSITEDVTTDEIVASASLDPVRARRRWRSSSSKA